jgi:hypothetical protein
MLRQWAAHIVGIWEFLGLYHQCLNSDPPSSTRLGNSAWWPRKMPATVNDSSLAPARSCFPGSLPQTCQILTLRRHDDDSDDQKNVFCVVTPVGSKKNSVKAFRISSQTAIATRTITQWRPFSKGSGIWHVGHPLGKSVVTLHRQLVVMVQNGSDIPVATPHHMDGINPGGWASRPYVDWVCDHHRSKTIENYMKPPRLRDLKPGNIFTGQWPCHDTGMKPGALLNGLVLISN